MSEIRHRAAWQRFHFIFRTSLSPRLTIKSKGIQASGLKKNKTPLLPQFMSDQFQEHPPKLDMKILK